MCYMANIKTSMLADINLMSIHVFVYIENSDINCMYIYFVKKKIPTIKTTVFESTAVNGSILMV